MVHDAAADMAPHLKGCGLLRDIIARLNPGNVVLTPLVASSGPLGVLAVGRCADHPPLPTPTSR